MADNLVFRPGFRVELDSFIPDGCKWFAINLGKDPDNIVIHFEMRFDHCGDKGKIVMNSMKDGCWESEQKESFCVIPMESDIKIVFQFNIDEIIIRLPSGGPISFSMRFPITAITFVSMEELQVKSIQWRLVKF